jgi:hypothetical protein
MDNFLTVSIVGSIVLTILLNLFPMLFPNTADKMQRKLEESARHSIEQQEDDSQPNVKLFFPWKVMLIGSIVLTILVNVVGYFSR